MTRVLRVTGWTLVVVGVHILLYLAYLLWFTNLFTDRAQADLLDDWGLRYGLEGERPEGTSSEDYGDVELGDAYAAMWFERDGQRILHDRPLLVVEGTTLDLLRRGPGHYVETAAPGREGNFAVSGHRTTYGAPFYDLDDLVPGDEVHVVDRDSNEWVYEVVGSEIVPPSGVWVIGDDPLDTGAPTMTMTTCHPRFSAAQRYIVFAELQGANA